MRILYVTTSFPVFSETFLQREARAMLKAGVEMRILSLHKGDPVFEGHPVDRFSKWSLLRLVYLLPITLFLKGDQLLDLAREMTRRRPASFLNFAENLLGLGAAIVEARKVREQRPDLIHCVWGSAPAAFGLVASRLCGPPFSMGAHAYDVFEFGGDWLLRFKARSAALVHVSTDVVANRLRRLTSSDKVARIRRGLTDLPPFKPMRKDRSCLRIVCVARLVEKKGWPYQLAIYRALSDAGIDFEGRIVGDGPMEEFLVSRIQTLQLGGSVSLLGRLSEAGVMEQLAWADLLFHTGVIARSGDRDGLPNVVPEAMACGVVVLGSPVSGVVEAVEHEKTGFLCLPGKPQEWVDTCRMLQLDDDLFGRTQVAARAWVEGEFVADRNTGELIRRMEDCVKRADLFH